MKIKQSEPIKRHSWLNYRTNNTMALLLAESSITERNKRAETEERTTQWPIIKRTQCCRKQKGWIWQTRRKAKFGT